MRNIHGCTRARMIMTHPHIFVATNHWSGADERETIGDVVPLAAQGEEARFITHAAEEEAGRMIKEHLYGKQVRERQGQQWGSGGREHRNVPVQPTEFTKDEQFVIACTRVAKKRRIADPFRMAHSEKWTRDQWDAAQANLEVRGVRAKSRLVRR